MTTPRFRLFYVDDSGSSASGLIVYAWIECDAAAWLTGWQSWLNLRQQLQAEHHIPATYRLHASEFVSGHGYPSTNPAWNRDKRLRHHVMTAVLAHLDTMPGIAIGTVYRRTHARRRAYTDHRIDVYQRLTAHLDQRLADHHEHGLVFGDGDGSDPTYADAHHALTIEHRRVIEDPQFPGAHRNGWLQLADLIAWTTYQHLHRNPTREFAWTWYHIYLADHDVNGGPLPL